MVTEQKQDNNPFLKELNLVKPNDSLINCIRMIPKIGDKNAKTLATVFQSKILSKLCIYANHLTKLNLQI